MKSMFLLCVVAACGGSPAASPDAGSPDATPPDAADPTAVYVFAPSYYGTNPTITPGARVLFYDADGNLVDRATAGLDGWAQGHVAAGGTVFSFQPKGFQPWMISTFVGVEPGDHLYTQVPLPFHGAPGNCVASPPQVVYDLTDLPTGTANLASYYEVLMGTSSICAEDDGLAKTPVAPVALTFSPPHTGDGGLLRLEFLQGGWEWNLDYDRPPSTIDLGALMPPAVSQVSYHPQGTTTWTADTSAGNGPAIGIVLQVSFGGYNDWLIALPPDRTSFTMPTLPSDIGALPNSQGADGFYVGSNDPGGYRAFRTDPLAMSPSYLPLVEVIPPPGIYRLQP